MLNMIEYLSIYLKKTMNMSEFLMSNAVHSIRSLYKLLSSYQDREVFRTLSNTSDGALCKKKKGENQKSEIPLSEFCPISGDWGELGITNFAKMSLIKCY